MAADKSLERQAILTDPVGHYHTHHSQPSKRASDDLIRLAEQRTQLQEQQAAGRLKTGQLSRQIGQAKQSGGSVEKLLSEMRLHSGQLKSVSQQLVEIEDAILAYFSDVAADDNSIHEATPGHTRKYRMGSASVDAIHVSLNDTAADEWNRYVESTPAASLYHRAEWQSLVQNTFGHAGYYFCARNNDGQISGVLPLVHLQSRLFGSFLVSMPYFNYGGAVGDSPLVEQQLMQAAMKQAAKLGASHIEFRDDIVRDDLPVRTDKVNMILSLPDSPEELWKSFTPKLRAQVRRPQREAPQILQGGAELLDDFYSVFSRNMRDLGTPVYGRNFFRNILKTFTQACCIVVIRLAGQPVAAAFLLGHRDTLEIPWASSLREVNRLSMNMLLYHEALTYALGQGYRHFDFGRSSRDSGTYRFKQQWGAQPRALYWHYWQANGDTLPSLNPDNPRYALAIKIWQRLPLTVTTALGPLIVKNLP